MKRHLTFVVFVLLVLAAGARATTVYFPVLDMTGATNDVTFNVRAVNNPIIFNNQFHYFPRNGTNFSSTGSFATNYFVPGHYTVAILGLAKTWSIYVTNTTDTLNAVDLSTSITIHTGIQSLTVYGSAFLTNDGHSNYSIIVTNDLDSVVAIGNTNFVRNTNGTGYGTTLLSSPSLASPNLTNAVNRGNAFRSPGSGANSDQIGASANASGTASLALGGASSATANSATTVGSSSLATAINATALGSSAEASAQGSTALGVLSSASHQNSTAVGAAAATTAADQVRLGLASQHVSIPGALVVGGLVTANGGGLSNAVDVIAGSGVNVVTGANNRSFTLDIASGVTNQWESDATNAAYGVVPLTAVLTNEARAVEVTNTGNQLGGSLVAPNGSASSPSIRFLNSPTTGLYSSGSGGTFSVTINNQNTWEFGDGAGGRMFRPNTDNAVAIGDATHRPSDIFSVQVQSVNNIASSHYGNGLGLSNTVDIIAGQGITVVTGANKRVYTIISTNFDDVAPIVFKGHVTFNSNIVVQGLSFPTNTWAGPTNTFYLRTNKQFFVASTDCALTNIGGQLAGLNTWGILTVSNSTASDIVVRSTASGLRAQGPLTTTALTIGGGKEGILSFESRELYSTNFVTSAQQ